MSIRSNNNITTTSKLTITITFTSNVIHNTTIQVDNNITSTITTYLTITIARPFALTISSNTNIMTCLTVHHTSTMHIRIASTNTNHTVRCLTCNSDNITHRTFTLIVAHDINRGIVSTHRVNIHMLSRLHLRLRSILPAGVHAVVMVL